MKKVKVTLRPGSLGKKIYLFPTPEALYVWLCAMENGEQMQVPGIDELVLVPGSFIEAELRGFKYSYEECGRYRRLDMVRLGLAQQPKNASGLLVSTHVGWVSGGLLPLRSYTDTDIDVSPITEEESRLHLSSLFNDDGE